MPKATSLLCLPLVCRRSVVLLQHPNTGRGYTIWWAYQDHDTFTPQPGPPPLDTNTTALLQAAAAAASQVGAPETWSPQYVVETKVAPHAKSQDKPPAPKPLQPPLKLNTAEDIPHNE